MSLWGWIEQFLCGLKGHIPCDLWSPEVTERFCVHCFKALP